MKPNPLDSFELAVPSSAGGPASDLTRVGRPLLGRVLQACLRRVMALLAPFLRRGGLIPGVPDAGVQADEELDCGPDRDRAIDMLARTIWGSARGETAWGKEALASVVLNRARRRGRPFGRTLEDVCLTLSCWNPNDPHHDSLQQVTRADPRFCACLDIARRALDGDLPDRTEGSTLYHHCAIRPFWAQGHQPVARIGRHVFYSHVAETGWAAHSKTSKPTRERGIP